MAPIIAARWNRTFAGAVVIVVTCPYCHREHTHGIGADLLDRFGTRVPDCMPDPATRPNYVLVDPDGLVVDLVQGRRR